MRSGKRVMPLRIVTDEDKAKMLAARSEAFADMEGDLRDICRRQRATRMFIEDRLSHLGKAVLTEEEADILSFLIFEQERATDALAKSYETTPNAWAMTLEDGAA